MTCQFRTRLLRKEVNIKIYQCEKFGECTTEKPSHFGKPVCDGCRFNSTAPNFQLDRPGKRLKQIIQQRYKITACQSCIKTAQEMDKNGSDWCIENLDELAAKMHRNAKGLTKVLTYTLFGLEKYKQLIREACNMLPHDIMPQLHKQAKDPNALQFLWMYVDKPAEGNELYWSVASVLKHASPARITVFGSHPGTWYTGEHIPFTPKGNRHRDRINKMKWIAHHQATAASFVWMMDDQYFIKPTSHDQIKVPRAWQSTANTKSEWGRIRTRTKRVLEQAGFKSYDYATHLPHYIEKKKLQETFSQFKFEPPLLWETVYGCVHRDKPRNPNPYFCRIGKPQSKLNLERKTRNAILLNHANKCWSPDLIDFIRSTLTQKEHRVVIDSNHHINILSKARAKKYFSRKGPRREKTTVEALKHFLKDGGVFYDCGANIGYHSLIIKSLYPHVTVHAFEPCKRTYLEMQSIIDVNGLDIAAHHFGLSNKRCKSDLLLSSVSDAQHSIHKGNSKTTGQTETITLLPLDSLKLPPPTVIKIDVELHELQTLQGAERIVNEHHPAIILEMRPKNQNFKKIQQWMNRTGYQGKKLDHLNWLFQTK